MSATLNAFPAVHTFNSPRSWVMAIIVLLHLGFFWALTSGLSRTFTIFAPPPATMVPVEPVAQPQPRTYAPEDYKVTRDIFVPPGQTPTVPDIEDAAPRNVTQERVPLPPLQKTAIAQPTPVEIQPMTDPRHPLSEPMYPPSAIRQGVEGTVLLSLQILESGRVGQVRVEASSGDSRLDDAAVREAKRWRLIAGTRDGVPVVLWKQVPVTFRLQDVRR